MNIVRTDAEIKQQQTRALTSINHGTQYPSMTYEDGIHDVITWLLGDDCIPLPTVHSDS